MAIVLNGVIYNGSGSNPKPPDATGIRRTTTKVGKLLIAASGRRNWVSRNAIKPSWELTWTNTNLATLNALRALVALNTTFTFVDDQGTSWVCQCEADALQDSISFTKFNKTSLYNITLTIHVAN